VTAPVDVLVVDDDDDLRMVLSELLAECGFRVASARHGREALDYLRDHPAPAVILLDWMMPVMSGLEFRREQARDERLKQIPVFLLTARGDLEESGDELTADRMFRKPIALPELLAALESVVDR
jgi:two-component system phosphate regulon response regulator PhoB